MPENINSLLAHTLARVAGWDMTGREVLIMTSADKWIQANYDRLPDVYDEIPDDPEVDNERGHRVLDALEEDKHSEEGDSYERVSDNYVPVPEGNLSPRSFADPLENSLIPVATSYDLAPSESDSSIIHDGPKYSAMLSGQRVALPPMTIKSQPKVKPPGTRLSQHLVLLEKGGQKGFVAQLNMAFVNKEEYSFLNKSP